MNKNIITSVQDGVYIVFLFKSDMSGFYLDLSFGFKQFIQKITYDDRRRIVNIYKKACDIEANDFSQNCIDLKSQRKDRGYNYETSTIFSRYYGKNTNFTDEQIFEDIYKMIEIYLKASDLWLNKKYAIVS